jgi:hypothetical protein
VPVPVLIPNESQATGARPTLPSHQNAVVVVGEAALALHFSNWQWQVGLLAASTICLHVGKRVRQLIEDDFAAVLAQLDGSAALSASARHHARTRLFGLQQACYQLGSLTTPPRQSGPVAVGPLSS